MTAPRDVMQAAAYAALRQYLQAVTDGRVPRPQAEAAFCDRILQAWEATVTGHAREQAWRNSMAVNRG